LLVATVPFGRASSDETQRSYSREDLDRLLAGWTVENVTIVRRDDRLTWVPEDASGGAEDDRRRAALITAIRPG
jgi:hypothetical protein